MSITIITATFNAVGCLPVLVESLRSQSNKNFEWVVADAGSEDGTLEYLDAIEDLNIKIIEGPDFGIYDALNKAIRASTNDYYLVMGADDFLYTNAIEVGNAALADHPDADLISAPVVYNDNIVRPRGKRPWYYGQFSYVAAHSVGLLIRKDLHKNIGFYSRKYPIAADQFFILKAVNAGAKLITIEIPLGVHGAEGVSGVDHAGVITEFFRIQVDVGFNKYVQTALACLRLLKNVRDL